MNENHPTPESDDGGVADVAAGSIRSRLIVEAISKWTKDLVDLGGRNNLLYYRDLRTGTLDLSSEQVRTEALSRLWQGESVSLLELFIDPDARRDAARRLRTIRARHRSNLEERGLDTLRLGFGLTTWTSERSMSTPNSPVLIWQMELEPKGHSADDFELRLIDAPEVNPVLLHLLASDFGATVEAGDLADFDDAPPGGDALSLVCSQLQSACSDIPGFHVTERVVLGNFSYAKLPMVRDLEQAAEQIAEHTLLSAIAGDPDALTELRGRHDVATDAQLVAIPPPDDEFLVLDADSSQSRVIAAVLANADLVVEGPPGTGKSQTIANLIATLVARGRSVLFVAEKRAAIEAVADRLRRVGLQDLMLDMHDGPANRRRTAEALGSALESVTSAIAPDAGRLHRTLVDRGRELDAYDHALHTPHAPWGLTPYQAIEGVLGTNENNHSQVRFRGSAADSITGEVIERGRDRLTRFLRFGGGTLIGDPDRGWGPTFRSRRAREATTVRQLIERSEEAEERVPALRKHSHEVSATLGLEMPHSVEDAATLVAAVGSVREVLLHFDDGIFAEDLTRLSEDIRPAGGSAVGRLFAAALRSSFRDARRRARVHLRDEASSIRELPDLVTAAATALGRWRLLSSDGPPATIPTTDLLDQEFEATISTLDALVAASDLPEQRANSFESVSELLTDLRSQRNQLIRMPELDELYQSLEGDGLLPALSEAIETGRGPEDAAEALEHAWLASILDRVAVELPVIGAFDAKAHEEVIEGFIEADREHLDLSADRVRRAWAEHTITMRNTYPEESELVSRQAKRKRGHLATRNLFQQAQHVLTAVKPCWMMSPLVVAQVLPRETCFDVVIFDEASQVQPADAVSSLLRGRRAVVAGDPHQLPPTTFFASSSGEDEDDDLSEDDGADAELLQARSTAVVGGYESILDVMGALLPPPHGRRTLAWHYRSRDERLITFSNAQQSLYDWSMTTFPGALAAECLSLELVRFVPSIGQPLSSPSAEVERVVELVLEHATQRPDASLGVIAFGVAHANRIDERLRTERTLHPELDDFFDESADEPFFIKNLERVQGDERDSILLTVGYGRTADGRIRYAFGPINQEGGERRLNVAITRARSSMAVVSSVSGREFDPERTKSIGARMLRDYLLYAESGGTDLGSHQREKPILNPFERDVERHLTAAGISLAPQFGASGFWIDFAAMHPERPSEPVLAIEADGASYHSSPTARDRDRLRREHLENLGWQFHRIWSTEWFSHREQQIERAVQAVAAAVAARDDDPVEPSTKLVSSPPDQLEHQRDPMGQAERNERPRLARGRSIASHSSRQLRSIVRWVKSDRLLRTDEEILVEVMNDLAFSRRGKRIVAEIERAIQAESR